MPKAGGKPAPKVKKDVEFLGTTRKDLTELPDQVKFIAGFALHQAQIGEVHVNAKPMKGFGGAAKVMEVVLDHEGDTYRTMYTVKLGDLVYVLHCFKKKSTSGIATPKKDLELIATRLKDAEKRYAALKRRRRHEKS